jgi:hypothetical protein
MSNEQKHPADAVGSSEGLAASWRSEPAPTHRCTTCGALWRFIPKRDFPGANCDSWNLRSTVAGRCCDSAPMREQIQPVTIGQIAEWLSARLAVYTMTQHLFGPKAGDSLQ